ncbi:hypothetical protein Bca52824_072707 [Brassica carinata]|uniref:acid phosphatase n=1 Tax=Brassica carinata TaxID=52824 RepID=A0A8X7Q988_BRACI|nr:hypothetical protein Bca52824_072707 [Brassica carinata]
MTLLLSLVPKLEAEFTTVEQAIKSDGSISFLVIGDWGRRGLYNQSQVALQMGKIGEKMDIDFVVSTGDNIYDNGMKSIDDPAFQLSFANIYISPSLQKPWYLVLGNHDYRGDVEAQLSPALRSIDSRWICMRSFIVDAEIAELFFVDTTPFVDAYFLNPEGQNYDWRGVSPRESYLQTTLKDLETSLRESTAKWKIVVGHHAIKSASIHGNTKELESLLLPILEANNVDLYVNGHDHCLQHISTSQSPIQFLTSGGGSKAWRGYYNWKTPEDMKFFYDGQGFMSIKITRTEMGIVFYDVFGNILHKWDTSKDIVQVVFVPCLLQPKSRSTTRLNPSSPVKLSPNSTSVSRIKGSIFVLFPLCDGIGVWVSRHKQKGPIIVIDNYDSLTYNLCHESSFYASLSAEMI